MDPRPLPEEDRHLKTKSKYTVDRQIPGAFEGETVTRRRFMTGTVHVAGAVAMSAIALPSIGFALGPIFEKKEVEWVPIGTPDDFSAEDYVPKVITETEGIGIVGQRVADAHAISANAAAAASTVRSMCSCVWTVDGNHASYGDGGA